MRDAYESPLNTRYCSPEMSKIFSDNNRYSLWRKLWIALAQAEQQLGLEISDKQIAEMKKFEFNIDFDLAEQREKVVRHDVMAHVFAFGTQAPSAMPIIHLGATSCYVTDNAEIMIVHQAFNLIQSKLINLMDKLQAFALKYKNLPTLGFTHLQPAQLTTVGKRAALWLQDLYLDYVKIDDFIRSIKLRGVKGTTGTQASFLSLFDGDHEKVKQLEQLIVKSLGYNKAYALSGQTYTRKFDYDVMAVLSGVAQSAYKFANDLRLLQSMKEIEEPFEKNQIGSSAMAYKRNPMRSERICGLARYVISLPVNQAITAGTQWLERTLDDSANKRITTAQGFLALDGILNLYLNIAENMVVYEKVIEKHIHEELPFMATEVILMECVKAGGDRQQLHELIRIHSMESAKKVKEQGERNDLIERIKKDSHFIAIHDTIDHILNPSNFIGRAPQQTQEFIETEVLPILRNHPSALGYSSEIKV